MLGNRGTRTGLATLAAITLAAGLSGCFIFQSAKFSPAIVKPGKKTNVVVKLVADRGATVNKMVPFVLVGLPSDLDVSLGQSPKFDARGDYGGPYPMFSDGAMRNVAIATEDCGFGGGTPSEESEVDWTLFRTGPKVSDRDKLKPPAEARIGIKTDPGAAAGQYQVAVFAGNWSEAGMPDGVPEEGEVVCSGGSFGSYTVAG
jgi:hypothetical protein